MISRLVVISIVLILFTSCGIYRQNVVNVPLLQNSGNGQLSSHISFNGLDAQAAYAVSKHIAVLANYSNLINKKNNYSVNNYSYNKHSFGEAGIGYYCKSPTGFVSELFIIAGNGHSSNFVTGGDTVGHTTPFSNKKELNYNRLLIQVDGGKTKGKWEFAVSPRIMLVNYYNVSDNYTDKFNYITSTYLYSEFGFTLRYNVLTYLKISAQSGITIPITGFRNAYYDMSPFNASIGLVMNLNFKKQDD